jgi:hypothetical protein
MVSTDGACSRSRADPSFYVAVSDKLQECLRRHERQLCHDGDDDVIKGSVANPFDRSLRKRRALKVRPFAA